MAAPDGDAGRDLTGLETQATSTERPINAKAAAPRKVISFIRHGKTEMNEHEDTPGQQWGAPNFTDPGFYDTRLSPRGVEQARKLGEAFQASDPSFDLLVVSPLTRALMTATHAFCAGKVSPGKRVVVSPLCTERIHTASEVGRLRSELCAEFPDFDFSNIGDGPWWYVPKSGSDLDDWRPAGTYLCPGEPYSVFTARLEGFKTWLAAQPENRIAVVCHWGVIRALTGRSVNNCAVVREFMSALISRPVREEEELDANGESLSEEEGDAVNGAAEEKDLYAAVGAGLANVVAPKGNLEATLAEWRLADDAEASKRHRAPQLFQEGSCRQIYPCVRGKILLLRGTPTERGLAHGVALKADIHAVLGHWRAQLFATFAAPLEVVAAGEGSQAAAAWVQTFSADFLAATSYLAAIERWSPGLIEEVRGMAEGAGIDFNEMLTFQLMDEYWFHGASVSAKGSTHLTPPEHCTAFGVAGVGGCPAVVAQTMDLESFRDGYQTVLRIEEEGRPSVLLFSHAGVVALCGINSSGMAVCVNNLSQLCHATSGLPVAFLIRAVLQCSTFETALALLLDAPHASGQNYTLGGDGRVVMVECSVNGTVTLPPPLPGGSAVHTNHPLHSRDFAPSYLAAQTTFAALLTLERGSECRLKATVSFLEQELPPATWRDIAVVEAISRRALALGHLEFPVCRHPSLTDPAKSCSIGSVVFVTGARPRMLCAKGPADGATGKLFEAYDFA